MKKLIIILLSVFLLATYADAGRKNTGEVSSEYKRERDKTRERNERLSRIEYEREQETARRLAEAEMQKAEMLEAVKEKRHLREYGQGRVKAKESEMEEAGEMQMWVDKDGVKHFSNAGAPQDTEFETFGEIKYDDAERADQLQPIRDNKAYEETVIMQHQLKLKHQEQAKADKELESQRRVVKKQEAIQQQKEKKYALEKIKIDPLTGTAYTPSGGGNYVNTRTGALNTNQGGGQYLDTQTGKIKRLE